MCVLYKYFWQQHACKCTYFNSPKTSFSVNILVKPNDSTHFHVFEIGKKKICKSRQCNFFPQIHFVNSILEFTHFVVRGIFQ